MNPDNFSSCANLKVNTLDTEVIPFSSLSMEILLIFKAARQCQLLSVAYLGSAMPHQLLFPLWSLGNVWTLTIDHPNSNNNASSS